MIPQLRFPEFTDEWQMKKLGDIASFIKDGTHGTHPDDPRGEYYLLSAKNLQHGTIEIDDSDRKISQIEYDSITKKYALKTSDILLSIVGTIGRVSQIPEKYLGNTAYQRSVAFLRFGGENSTFIAQLFNGRKFQNELRRRQVVSAQPGIYLGDIAKIQINLPSKPEQGKIADFLTAVDERIGVGEKKLELLETYKRGVMQKIFNQQIRFKDENGEDYPDWEEKKLGELGETYNGLTGKSGDDFGIGANFITYMQIFSDSRISQNFGKVRINPGEKQNTVEYGDIFFTTSSETPEETGYTSVLLNNPSDTYLNSFCFGYRADKNILSPEFARYLFHSSNVRSSIVRLAQGSTRYNISKIQLMKMKLAIPSFEEQQKIATFLTALDDKITAEKSKLTATRKFKKALLQKMFV